jgi:hypothetical protein
MNDEGHFPENGHAKSVYLDQSVYGHMLDQGGGSWGSSSIGGVLADARSAGTAEVWAGPTNVIEAMQASDPARRRALAATMLELIDARRLWWGSEFEAVDDFFGFLRWCDPKAVRTTIHFEYHATSMRQIWLGGLGLLSATNNLLLEGAVRDLHRLKMTNRLLHARLASDPNGWIDKMVSAARNWETTDENTFAPYDAMKVEEMEKEIDAPATTIGRLDGKHLAKLTKNRDEIARAYGAVELGLMFRSVLPLPGSLELTIDAASLVPVWSEKITTRGGPPLPKGIWAAWSADPGNLVGPRPEFYAMLETAIHAAPDALLASWLSFEVVIEELQKCISDKEIPTGGLTFDADHAAALKRFNVVVCRDEKLTEAMKRLARKVGERCNGQHVPVVVATGDQLRAALS